MKRILSVGGLVPWLILSGCGSPESGIDPGPEQPALDVQELCDGSLVTPCEQLASSLQFPDTVFTSSTTIASGTVTQSGQPIAAHCLVTGKMNERLSEVDGQSYAIGFEMRLPLQWNGRFF